MKLKSALVCCVLLIPILAGCAGGNGGQKPIAGDTHKAPASATEAAKAPTTEPTYPTEPEPPATPVETPYGTLYHSQKWEEAMRTEQEQTQDGLRVSFFGAADGEEYLLFSVTIGGSASNAGQLTDAQGTEHNVLVEMADLGDMSEMTEEQKNYLYAMQEDINFVIQKLNDKE